MLDAICNYLVERGFAVKIIGNPVVKLLAGAAETAHDQTIFIKDVTNTHYISINIGGSCLVLRTNLELPVEYNNNNNNGWIMFYEEVSFNLNDPDSFEAIEGLLHKLMSSVMFVAESPSGGKKIEFPPS